MEVDGFYLGLILAGLFLMVCVGYLYRNRSKLSESIPFFLFIWNLLASITLIFLFLIGSETYFRFYVDRTDAFAISKLTDRWLDRHYQANNIGVRDNIDYNKDRSDQPRITFIGDSFTAGHGVKNVEDRFVNLIRAKLKSVEVHSICANGLESDDHLFLIGKFKNDGYQFDRTVLIYNLNDITYLSPQKERIYDKLIKWSEDQNFLLKNSYFINALWARWTASSDPEISQYYAFVKSTYEGKTWEEQKRMLIDIIQALREVDSQLLVITFPFLSNLSPSYTFLPIHRQLNAFWDEQNIHHLDLWDIFKNKDANQLIVNKYDPHPNEKAHELTSQAILDFLEKHEIYSQ